MLPKFLCSFPDIPGGEEVPGFHGAPVTEWCTSCWTDDQYVCFRLDWHVRVTFDDASGCRETERLNAIVVTTQAQCTATSEYRGPTSRAHIST